MAEPHSQFPLQLSSGVCKPLCGNSLPRLPVRKNLLWLPPAHVAGSQLLNLPPLLGVLFAFLPNPFHTSIQAARPTPHSAPHSRPPVLPAHSQSGERAQAGGLVLGPGLGWREALGPGTGSCGGKLPATRFEAPPLGGRRCNLGSGKRRWGLSQAKCKATLPSRLLHPPWLTMGDGR